MTRLEDRLDHAADAVERRMVRIALPPVEVLRQRRRGRSVAATAFAAIVLIGSIGGTALLFGGSDTMITPAAPSDDVAPTTTVAVDVTATTVDPAPDVRYDSEAALAWGEWVTEAMAMIGWDDSIDTSYETPTPVTGGGSVTALAHDAASRVALVVDLQAFADGEYQPDPAWQREVAGSNVDGTSVPEGTLFTPDTGGEMSLVLLVTEDGVLTIVAEATPLVALPDSAELESLARSLAPAISAVTDPSGRPTAPTVDM